MKELEQCLIDVFKEFKVPKNGIIRSQTLYGRIRTWDRPAQDGATSALNQLISDGYIAFDDNHYILLENGYNYIFRNYSIVDTEKVILNEFKIRKLGVDHILPSNTLISLQQSVERFHFDNFTIALERLISQKHIKELDHGYILTGKGYDEIYS